MSEFQVLHQEPQHKVRSFADEIKERRGATLDVMRPAFSKLLQALCEQFDLLKRDAPQVELSGVVFAETKWTKDGQLVIEFGFDPKKDHDFGPRYHIDDAIHEIVASDDRVAPMVPELAQWFSALLDQFAVLKKSHPSIDLDAITFDDMRWLDSDLVFEIRLHGKPFVPREARWV